MDMNLTLTLGDVITLLGWGVFIGVAWAQMKGVKDHVETIAKTLNGLAGKVAQHDTDIEVINERCRNRTEFYERVGKTLLLMICVGCLLLSGCATLDGQRRDPMQKTVHALAAAYNDDGTTRALARFDGDVRLYTPMVDVEVTSATTRSTVGRDISEARKNRKETIVNALSFLAGLLFGK
jgi:predicted small secreted protein